MEAKAKPALEAGIVGDDAGGGGGEKSSLADLKDMVNSAAERDTDRIANEDCAGLFFSPENNTPENRKLLSRRLQQAIDNGGFTVFSAALADKGKIKPTVPIFTADDGSIIAIQGRSFFTGQLDGKPLSGAYNGLNLSGVQELMIIHEFLHAMGLVGPDDAGQTYTLANGQTVTGSAEVSQAVRDHCYH